MPVPRGAQNIPSLGGIFPVNFIDQISKATGAPILWRPNGKFQLDIISNPADEIAVAGEKGSGKSDASIIWMVKGNLDKPIFDRHGKPILVNISYVYHPGFYSVIVRKNVKDLEEYMLRAKSIWEPAFMRPDGTLGAQVLGPPWRVRWPGGGLTECGHLGDRDSWQQFIGKKIIRLLVEEAVLIEEEELYLNLRSTVRSPFREMKAQTILTFNPIGPGLDWLSKRFREFYDRDGNLLPPGTVVKIPYKDELTGESYTQTRVLLEGHLSDNPYQDTPDYRANLLGLPQPLRDAYYYGRWGRGVSAYFDIFRRDPQEEKPGVMEPPNAKHVFPDIILKPALRLWHPREIGADWGFAHNAAAVKGVINPKDGRVVIDWEFVANRVATYEFGIEIALSVREYIKQTGESVTVWLSPDAFSQESEVVSEADRIMEGASRILGVGSIWLADEDSDTKLSPIPRQGVLAFRRAYNRRVQGFSYIYDLLRWTETALPVKQFSYEEAWQIFVERGADAQAKYVEEWKKAIPKPKPSLLFSESCVNICKALEKAQRDQKNVEDVQKKHWEFADVLDALRYLVAGLRIIPKDIPLRFKYASEIEEMETRGATPYELLWKQRWVEHHMAEDKEEKLKFMSLRLPPSRRNCSIVQ